VGLILTEQIDKKIILVIMALLIVFPLLTPDPYDYKIEVVNTVEALQITIDNAAASNVTTAISNLIVNTHSSIVFFSLPGLTLVNEEVSLPLGFSFVRSSSLCQHRIPGATFALMKWKHTSLKMLFVRLCA
jgi:hypothetical protein